MDPVAAPVPGGALDGALPVLAWLDGLELEQADTRSSPAAANPQPKTRHGDGPIRFVISSPRD